MFIFCLFLLVVIILLIAIGIFLDKGSSYNDGEDCYIASVIIGAILFGCVISIPISRVIMSDDIVGFKTIQETVNTQRQVNNDYEQAILTTKIIDANYRLAKWKNQNVWYRLDWWIPDSVEELESIK